MENSFASRHPELVAEWSLRNAPLTADDISYGSNKKYWWRGSCGHEWLTSPKSRSAGENCPICSGTRVIPGINDLASIRPDLMEEWASDNTIDPTAVSVGSRKEALWKCRRGHTWKASVKRRSQGTGCPYCSHNLVLSGFNDLASQKPEVALGWSPRNYPLLPSQVTAFSNKKVWWRCHNGHEWNALISTRAYGSKCPYCSGRILLPGYNDLATRQPELCVEWSDRNTSISPNMVNEKSSQNVWWKCCKCGYEWKAVIRKRVHGSSCPVCADRNVLPGYNDFATTDPLLLHNWDYSQNQQNPQTVSRKSHKSVWWKCEYGHSYKAQIWERVFQKAYCPECAKEFHELFPKLLCLFYAKENNLEMKHDDVAITGYPLDIYFPYLSLAFRFDSRNTTRSERITGVLEHLCKARGIRLVTVAYTSSTQIQKIAEQIISGFQAQHIYFTVNVKEDISMCVNLFYKMKALSISSKANNL